LGLAIWLGELAGTRAPTGEGQSVRQPEHDLQRPETDLPLEIVASAFQNRPRRAPHQEPDITTVDEKGPQQENNIFPAMSLMPSTAAAANERRSSPGRPTRDDDQHVDEVTVKGEMALVEPTISMASRSTQPRQSAAEGERDCERAGRRRCPGRAPLRWLSTAARTCAPKPDVYSSA